MRLDAGIRQVAQMAQARRRAAAERVKKGEIQHLNFMPMSESLKRAEENLAQLREKDGDEGLAALADALNYGVAAIQKGGEGG